MIIIMEVKKELNRLERKKGQKFALLANTFTPVGTYVIIGALMIIYAGDVLSLSSSKISSILALIPLVSILRFFLLNQLTKFGKVKLMQVTSFLQLLLIILMILIPEQIISYKIYLSILITYSLLTQLGGGTAWQPLLRDITTTEDRGRFFSGMRLVFTLVSLLVTGITPLIIGESISAIEYKMFLFLPLISKIIMIFMVQKVPELQPIINKKRKFSIKETFREIRSLKDPLIMIILVQCTFFPLFILYLKQVLNLPSNIVTTSVFIGTLGNAVSLLLWGQISDIVGFRNTLSGVHILGLLQLPFLLFIQPIIGLDSATMLITALLIYSFIDGMVLAGSGIAMTSIQHFYTTKERSIFIFSVYSAITLLINALWIFINGKIITDFSEPIILQPFISRIFYLDGVKVFMISMAIITRIILFLYVRKLPNIKPWFGLSDFFTSLNPTSIRTLLQSTRIHKLDGNGREMMSYNLGRRRNPFSIHSLISLLKDPSYDVKVSAIRELGRSGSTLAGIHLYELLKNPKMSIYHEHIVWSLGQLGWEEAIEDMLIFLESDRSEKLKAVSARALGRIRSNKAIPMLQNLIKVMTPTFHLSSSACWALIKLDIKNSAFIIFSALPLYKSSNIRYEIMDMLCPHLNIDNLWILKYGQDQGGWKALKQFTEDGSPKWKIQNSDIIKSLYNMDVVVIQKKYNVYIEQSQNSIYCDLNKVLQKQSEWNSLCLLASAQMLLNSSAV